jgi:hypothetical protein
VSRCMRQMLSPQILTGFLIPAPKMFSIYGICDQHTYICIDSHVKSID